TTKGKTRCRCPSSHRLKAHQLNCPARVAPDNSCNEEQLRSTESEWAVAQVCSRWLRCHDIDRPQWPGNKRPEQCKRRCRLLTDRSSCLPMLVVRLATWRRVPNYRRLDQSSNLCGCRDRNL